MALSKVPCKPSFPQLDVLGGTYTELLHEARAITSSEWPGHLEYSLRAGKRQAPPSDPNGSGRVIFENSASRSWYLVKVAAARYICMREKAISHLFVDSKIDRLTYSEQIYDDA
jgi:hypothetical protein